MQCSRLATRGVLSDAVQQRRNTTASLSSKNMVAPLPSSPGLVPDPALPGPGPLAVQPASQQSLHYWAVQPSPGHVSLQRPLQLPVLARVLRLHGGKQSLQACIQAS